MTRTIPLILMLGLAACGGSNDSALENAAEQSGPAAAAVLENAAENGMDPQNALAVAGNAQVTATPEVSAQARPNTAQNPNPQQAGQPPEKVVTEPASDEHEGHNSQ